MTINMTRREYRATLADPNRATNRNLAGPNTAHGRYEFDRQNAQPDRLKFLASLWISHRTPKTHEYAQLASTWDDLLTQDEQHNLNRLVQHYLNTGQLRADAEYTPQDQSWIKLVRPEHLPEYVKLSLDNHDNAL